MCCSWPQNPNECPGHQVKKGLTFGGWHWSKRLYARKSTDVNLRRVFTHLQLPPVALVAFDIEEAFNSVNWLYMVAVLEVLGFVLTFPKWLDILNKSPMAQIKLSGEPSPALFALVMEPLASMPCWSDGNSWNPSGHHSGEISTICQWFDALS